MPVTNYTVIDGELVHENRAGMEHDYLPDPLGSTVALLNSSQTQTDNYTYWPFGEVRTSTGTTATPFQFVGTFGYYRDSAQRTYVRKRYLAMWAGRWLTVDPIGFWGGDWNLYRYVESNPVTISNESGEQQPGRQPRKPPPGCKCGCKGVPCRCGTPPPSPPVKPKRKPRRGECWYNCPPGKPQTGPFGIVTGCMYTNCKLTQGPPDICPSTLSLTVPNTNALIGGSFDASCGGGSFPWLDPS